MSPSCLLARSRPECRPLLAHALVSAAVLLGAGCDRETPAEPELRSTSSAPLAVTPASLAFTIPPTSTGTLTASVQFTGLITASTSNASCATVSPLSAPATKPPRSSQYVATFTVTPAGGGSCAITIRDKQGRQVQVPVTVSVDPIARIVFVSATDDPANEIYTIGTGATPIRLTNSSNVDGHPDLSYDRTKIAFISLRDDPHGEIYVIDADGSNVQRLTDNDLAEEFPIFSPDGGSIAFGSRGADGDEEVWIMNSDGSSPRRLTVDPDHTDTPTGFSPDGSKLLVTTDNSTDGFQIITIDAADGANPTLLTAGSVARYSPDGSQIVFARDHDIYIADADGSDATPLTSDGDFNFYPVFSPAGDRIVFVSGFNSHLYTMNTDGSGRTQITSGRFDDHPDWK